MGAIGEDTICDLVYGQIPEKLRLYTFNNLNHHLSKLLKEERVLKHSNGLYEVIL